MMKTLTDVIKSISLKKILTVFFAGVLAFVTTACATPGPEINAAKTSGAVEDQASTNAPNKELYAPVQTKNSDGMYPYKDTDIEPSADTKNKVRKLVDSASK
ncbi:MAG: DUF6658 family protein [Microcoleaceae cyanobacterium]